MQFASNAGRVIARYQIARVCFASALTLGSIGCRQDMQDQPKSYPQRGTAVFADARSVRPQVVGTVARSQSDGGSYFETGQIDGKEGDGLPLPVTADLLARGQERFNIYCTPCHSRVGNGQGMIVQRGYYPAGNLHSERLRQAPLGHFFKVITEGFGAMPTYRAELRPEERWAVAAYIRALQLSQNAKTEDVQSGTRVAPLQEIAEHEGLPPGFANVSAWNSTTTPPPVTVRVEKARETTAPAVAGGEPAPGTGPALAAPMGKAATKDTSTGPAEAPPKVATPAPTAKPVGDSTAGLQVYANNCLMCHQATRAGMPPMIPSLVGIVPRVGETHIRDVVMNGVPTGKPPMPAFGRLSPEDLDNLIAYLKSAK